jgi:hypothetical protein
LLFTESTRAHTIIGTNFNEAYFDYFHRILKESDTRKIITYVRKELDTYAEKKGLNLHEKKEKSKSLLTEKYVATSSSNSSSKKR